MTEFMRLRQIRFRRQKNGSSFMLSVPELDIRRGETLAVVGQSGCGKSTLMDILALILKPDEAGEFVMAGQDGGTAGGGRSDVPVDLFRAGRKLQAAIRGTRIGYVLQSGGLFPFLNVIDNIMLPGKLCGMSSARLKSDARALAVDMGIADQLYKKPQYLSGGQRQRVAIARALIHSPSLVLADEPTAAVDSVSAEEICSVLKKSVQDRNAALVVVSHDRTLMRRHADFEVTFSLERADGIVSTLQKPVSLRQ